MKAGGLPLALRDIVEHIGDLALAEADPATSHLLTTRSYLQSAPRLSDSNARRYGT